MAYFVLTTS